jgi:hypothetical protein
MLNVKHASSRIVAMNDSRLGFPKCLSRQSRPAMRLGLALAILLVLPVAVETAAQLPEPPNPNQMGRRGRAQPTTVEDTNSFGDQLRMRMANTERQRSIVADTNKLLRLAAELNAEVSTANSDSLSPAQLHKLGEIEKLARNVKSMMSSTGREPPIFQDVPRPARP